MAYTKQNFENGKVLTAEQLNRMDAGIAEAAAQVEAIELARANGEFNGRDGQDGYTPVKNVDYFDGKDGEDGTSPVVTVAQITGGHRITVTDAGGTKTVDVMDGRDGQDGYTPVKNVDYFDGADGKDGYTPRKNVDYFDGEDGQDGVSPVISVEAITGGHRITVTDAGGTKTVDVMDGVNGKDGTDGQPGTDGKDGADGRGIKSVTRTAGNGAAGTADTYTITYTDNTTGTFTVYNGKDGSNGSNGVGIGSIVQTTASTADGGTNVFTVTLTNGESAAFSVKNGSRGSQGEKGEKGSTGDRGATGNGISSAVLNADYTLTLTFTDGTKYTTPSLRGATGATGSDASVTAENIQSALGYSPVAPYSGWESVAAEITEGYSITTGLYEGANGSGRYMKASVFGYTKLKVTGYQWTSGSGYALCAFYDKTNTLLSSVPLTNNTQYTDYAVDVPANAFYVMVNGKTGNAMTVSGLKNYNCEVLATGKANRVARWVTPDITRKDGVIIDASGTGERNQSGGQLATCDVTQYKKVIVKGYQYDLSYGFDVCCFYTESGGLISSHQGTTSNSVTYLELDVPDKAVTLKVTGGMYAPKVSEITAFQEFDVEDVLDAVRPVGKKVIALGDSITALGTGSTGWLKYFLEKTGCEMVANVAVNSAVLKDSSGTTYDGNPSADNQTNNTLGNQVQKIISSGYDAPDIILIAIGTNGGISITKEQIRAAYYGSGTTLIDLANVDRTTDAGAYRWCLEKLHATYPNAIIFWCTPIMGYQATRSAENAMAYAESLRIATEYSGQMIIDTIRCGINGVNEKSGANGQYLVDGLHPNANGAKKIGYYNAAKVIPFLGNAFALS